MKDKNKTKAQLIEELVELRQRNIELETLAADQNPEAKLQKPDGTSGLSKIQVSGINIEWFFDNGQVTFEDLPIIMLWIDTTLMGLMAGVQKMVGTERFLMALQSQGRESVEADWQVISQFPTFQEGFAAIANIAAVAGWGNWQIVSLDHEAQEVRIRVYNSWEGAYQKAINVSWGSGMLAGKMAGYCTKLFGINCWAEQTTFIAKGNNYDEFIVQPSDRSVETEIDKLLVTDNATRADLAVALQKLEKEIVERNQAEAELRQYHNQLEELVANRTAELMKTNSKLKEEITERKRTEAALREGEQRFRSAFDNAPIGMALVERDHTILEANRAFCEMIGYLEQELVGKYFKDITCPNDTQISISYHKKLFAGEMEKYQFEKCYLHKDGHPIGALLSVSAVRDANNETVYAIAQIQDISLQKEAEEALKAYSERLEDMVEERTKSLESAQEQLVRQGKLAVLGQLAGGIGHELRNPLGVISNAVYFLQMILSDADDTIKEYLDIIANRVQESEKIVTDLLSLSRTRSANPQEVTVSNLITEVLHRYPPAEGITVTTSIAPATPNVFVDSQQIGQVLGNLITNAYQAMPDGGPLAINVQPKQNAVYVTVADTGEGMSADTQEKIFEPLFTTKPKGIGLGLAVSKNLVEVNGGTLNVKSEAGKGSAFILGLPITP